MPFVALPDQINLGSPKYADFYKQASLKISGKKPGTFVEQKGAPMIYGLTIPNNAPDRDLGGQIPGFRPGAAGSGDHGEKRPAGDLSGPGVGRCR